MSAPATNGTSAELPFTGGAFTFPIAILGLILTAVGFTLRKLGREAA